MDIFLDFEILTQYVPCTQKPRKSVVTIFVNFFSRFQEVSIFVFEKKLADKLHKPRRKETVTEILKKSVHYLEMLRQPKLILKVVHSVEDCNETLAFAAEPVIASLANILAYQASIGGRAVNGPPSTGASITATAMPRPAHAREYNFLDFEIKYGIRQVSKIKAKKFMLRLSTRAIPWCDKR